MASYRQLQVQLPERWKETHAEWERMKQQKDEAAAALAAAEERESSLAEQDKERKEAIEEAVDTLSPDSARAVRLEFSRYFDEYWAKLCGPGQDGLALRDLLRLNQRLFGHPLGPERDKDSKAMPEAMPEAEFEDCQSRWPAEADDKLLRAVAAGRPPPAGPAEEQAEHWRSVAKSIGMEDAADLPSRLSWLRAAERSELMQVSPPPPHWARPLPPVPSTSLAPSRHSPAAAAPRRWPPSLGSSRR